MVSSSASAQEEEEEEQGSDSGGGSDAETVKNSPKHPGDCITVSRTSESSSPA